MCVKSLKDYKKQKPWLVCVDSDGCAMDTMDIKHYTCFGPCMVTEWGLEQWQEEILARWNQVNLYTITRGINRFKGLSLALSEIHERYCAIPDIDDLVYWTEHSGELSNEALKREIARKPDSVSLQKALAWSAAVNCAITALPEEKKRPFENAKAALAYAHEQADVAIISSANLDAVLEEWSQHGLLEHTDIVLTQNAGSKAFCIGELLKKGYAPENVVMCGDAPGDLQAAEKNGVYFYPILVRREKESWQEFIATACDRLIDGTFGGEYQQQKRQEFFSNLGAKE